MPAPRLAALALAALAAGATAGPTHYTIVAVPSIAGSNSRLAAIAGGIAAGSASVRGGGASSGLVVQGQRVEQVQAFGGTATAVSAVDPAGAIGGLGSAPAGCCAHAFFAPGPQADPQWIFEPGLDAQSRVQGMNKAGAMAGMVQFDAGQPEHAFVAQPGRAPVLIAPLVPGLSGHANAINASRTVVGAMEVETTRPTSHAFSWHHGTLVELRLPEGPEFVDSEANAINTAGWIVGYVQRPSPRGGVTAHATLWRGDEIVDLGFDPGTAYSIAHGVDDAGTVVGTRVLADGSSHGWVGAGGEHADLEPLVDNLPAGVTVYEAVAIDEQGRIAVNLLDPAHPGRGRGAVLVPADAR